MLHVTITEPHEYSTFALVISLHKCERGVNEEQKGVDVH